MDYLVEFDKLVMNKCIEARQADNMALNNIALGRVDRSQDGGFNAKKPILKKDIIRMISNSKYNVKEVIHHITDDFIEAINIAGYTNEQIDNALETSSTDGLSVSSSTGSPIDWNLNRSESDGDEVGVQISPLALHRSESEGDEAVLQTPVRINTMRQISSASGPRIRGASPNSPNAPVRKKEKKSSSSSLSLEGTIQEVNEHTKKGQGLSLELVARAGKKVQTTITNMVKTPNRITIRSPRVLPAERQLPQTPLGEDSRTTDEALINYYLTGNYTKKAIKQMARNDLTSADYARLEELMKHQEGSSSTDIGAGVFSEAMEHI